MPQICDWTPFAYPSLLICQEAKAFLRKFDVEACVAKLRAADSIRKYSTGLLEELCDRQLTWFEEMILGQDAASVSFPSLT